MDEHIANKKNIPGPNKYNSWKRPASRGYTKFNAGKHSILECVSYEKKSIPGSNVYNPKPSMADISKKRNVPRAGDKPDTSGKMTVRLQLKKDKTPAPGAKLNDKTIDVNRPRSIGIKIGKTEGKSFIQ